METFRHVQRHINDPKVHPTRGEANGCAAGLEKPCELVGALELDKLPLNPAATNSRVPLRSDARDSLRLLKIIQSRCGPCRARNLQNRNLPCRQVEKRLSDFLESKILVN